MNKVILLALFICLTHQAYYEWEFNAQYDKPDVIGYGGCDYNVLWWIEHQSPDNDYFGVFEAIDDECEPDYQEVDHSSDYNCQSHVWCGEESQCCGGPSEVAYCCDEGYTCAEDTYVTTKCVAADTPDEDLGCPFGYDPDSCTTVSGKEYIGDAWCQSSCVNAGYVAPACDAETEDASRFCECGCMPLPYFECPLPETLITDSSTCYAVDIRATDAWCVSSCLGAALELHPACDPESPDNDVTCWCGCSEESQTELSSESSSSEEEGGGQFGGGGGSEGAGSITTFNPNEKCDAVTFYSECNLTGESVTISDNTDCLDWAPKSFCIPSGTEITLFDVCQYSGQNAIFSQTVHCLDNLDIISMLSEGVVVTGQKKSLKRAEKKEFVQKFEIRKV